ncbi:hypothetical protein CEXT_580141 [Caerostris extrusa]|uniref:Uncharacterized protein n=1 Tax=Caerostris extrusa TaxID=172846 RepID=A0AAV4R7S4_CAEEX|nr:hypothetical protein CEXT_580141 [Caerostris extrusa]
MKEASLTTSARGPRQGRDDNCHKHLSPVPLEDVGDTDPSSPQSCQSGDGSWPPLSRSRRNPVDRDGGMFPIFTQSRMTTTDKKSRFKEVDLVEDDPIRSDSRTMTLGRPAFNARYHCSDVL